MKLNAGSLATGYAGSGGGTAIDRYLAVAPNRTVLRMDYDLFAPVWIYAGGVALLWFAI